MAALTHQAAGAMAVMVILAMLGLLVTVPAHAYEWGDCLAEGGDCDAALGCLQFTSVSSAPDPVVRGGDAQTVSKSGVWSGKQSIGALDVQVCGQPPREAAARHPPAPHRRVAHAPRALAGARTPPQFEQYYRVKLIDRWVPFLKITVDFCKDYDGVCPIRAGGSFVESKAHPPLNRLTPTGWYRSLQKYYLPAEGGRYVGCVWLDVEYVASRDLQQQ